MTLGLGILVRKVSALGPWAAAAKAEGPFMDVRKEWPLWYLGDCDINSSTVIHRGQQKFERHIALRAPMRHPSRPVGLSGPGI